MHLCLFCCYFYSPTLHICIVRNIACHTRVQAGRDPLRGADAGGHILRRSWQDAAHSDRVVESHQPRLLHSALHTSTDGVALAARLSAAAARLPQHGRLQSDGEQRLCQATRRERHQAHRARVEDGRRLGLVQSRLSLAPHAHAHVQRPLRARQSAPRQRRSPLAREELRSMSQHSLNNNNNNNNNT